MEQSGQGLDARQWKKKLAPYRHADAQSAVLQLVSTLGLFVLSWAGIYVVATQVTWGLALLLSPVPALLLVRIFILQHDCGHGSFFASKRSNDAVGFLLGVLTLTPYHYWKRTHAVHHATSGNLDKRSSGDIDTLTVAEYRALPRWRRLAYRLYRNPVVMFGIGPVYQFFLKHRVPWDAPLSWRTEWAGVVATNLLSVALWAGIWLGVGWQAVLWVQLPIHLVAGPIGVWLFYVQHQFEGTYWARNGEWDFYRAGLEGCSFYDLPRVLHWFTGNIGLHHIHHLASRIPNYSLQRCFREVAELQQATRLSLRSSLHCVRFKLWDETSASMVGFDVARTR